MMTFSDLLADDRKDALRSTIVSYTNNAIYSWYKLGVLVKPFIAVLVLYSDEVLVLGECHI